MSRVIRQPPHLYTPNTLNTLTLLGTLLAITPLQAGIFRCEATDGSVAFAQFPCRSATLVKVVATTPVNVIADSALTAAERQALAQLDANMEKRAQDRRKINQHTRRQLARENAAKAKSCARSQRQLGQLRDSKRHGYRLGDSAKLDERQNQLRRAIERDC